MLKKSLLAFICAALIVTGCGAQTADVKTTHASSEIASSENTTATSETTSKSEENQESSVADSKIKGEDFDENGGADLVMHKGDNKASRFYKNPDFYNLKNDDTLTIIENFKTMQQTTEWSCGNVTALMVLENLGLNDDAPLTEMAIAIDMKSHTDLETPDAKPGSANNYGEYGTDVSQMYSFFKNNPKVKIVETNYIENPTADDLYSDSDSVPSAVKGNLKKTFHANSLYSSENAEETDKWVDDAKDSYFVQWITNHLKANRPIMVEWSDWSGHWQAIIGYENNGTPHISDDTLIFADPYDTTDHSQDGYYTFPLERWFYMWHDHMVAPKPLQTQPFIVIDKAE